MCGEGLCRVLELILLCERVEVWGEGFLSCTGCSFHVNGIYWQTGWESRLIDLNEL